MSESGFRSATDWARNVGEGDPHAFEDIERVILDCKPESDRSVALRNSGAGDSSKGLGWVSVVVGLLIIAVPVLGAVQYWDGAFGARYGGNVDVEFDAGRASVIVPICFGFLSLVLLWNVFEWVREGRPRLGRYLFPGVYFGACAVLGLVFAKNLGVEVLPGASLEASVMWLCVALSVASVLGYAVLGRETQRSRDQKAREKLRIERRDVGGVLVSRGLMTDSELQTLTSRPFGSFINDGKAEG